MQYLSKESGGERNSSELEWEKENTRRISEMRAPAGFGEGGGRFCQVAGGSGAVFQPEWQARPRGGSSRPPFPGDHLQPGSTQELWDANSPLGMLNGAFRSPRRGKMSGERNFSFEVSLGEDQ